MNTLRSRDIESDAIPPEALAYNDDITKDGIATLQEKARGILSEGKWRVYEGALNGKPK